MAFRPPMIVHEFDVARFSVPPQMSRPTVAAPRPHPGAKAAPNPGRHHFTPYMYSNPAKPSPEFSPWPTPQPYGPSYRRPPSPKPPRRSKKKSQSAPDANLNRINAVAFATARGLDEDATIGAFVRAAQLGLFDMTWTALVPGLRRRAGDQRGVEDARPAALFLLALRRSCPADPGHPGRGDVHRQSPRAPHRRARPGQLAAARIYAADFLGHDHRSA